MGTVEHDCMSTTSEASFLLPSTTAEIFFLLVRACEQPADASDANQSYRVTQSRLSSLISTAAFICAAHDHLVNVK